MKILLVESDSSIVSWFRRFAEKHRWILKIALNGQEAQDICRDYVPHVILQDGGSLYTSSGHLVRQISDEKSVPSVLLVPPGKVGQFTSYVLNDFDEFLTKPLEADEMAARLRMAVAKHRNATWGSIAAPEIADSEVRYGPFRLDPAQKCIFFLDTPLRLTPKKYQLLALFLEYRGDLLSSQEIIQHIWFDSPRAAANDVQQCVHQLRRKIIAAGGFDQCIRNEKGFGYGLACGGCENPCTDSHSHPRSKSQDPL